MLSGSDQKNRVREMITSIVGAFIDARCPEKARADQWDLIGIESDILTQFGVKIDTAELQDSGRELFENEIIAKLNERYDEKESVVSSEVMRETERMIMLNVIDNQWKDHLLSMDHLKEGIYLRGYGQKDPLIEYKKESFTLFQDMMERIEDEAIRYLYFLQPYDEQGNILTTSPIQLYEEDGDDDDENTVHAPAPAAAAALTDFTRNIQRKKEKELQSLQYIGGEASSSKPKPVVKAAKVGRNDLCPCGSGKKYKKCHGV